MDDLISRQATIDAIEQHKTAVLGDREWDEGIAYGYATAHRHFVDIVKQLPSAERHGHWDGDSCSVCWFSWSDVTYDAPQMQLPYCPNCGAKMEGEQNG